MKEKSTSLSPPERITNGYLALMLSVFLVYPGLNGYAGITRHKWYAFLALSLGWMALLAGFGIKKLLSGRAAPLFPRRWQPQQLLIAGFLLWSALSTLCSVSPKLAFWGSARREGLITLLLYGGGCLLASFFARPRAWMLWLFGGAVSVNCGVALLQLAGRNPLGLYPAGMTYFDANVRYAGSFLGTIGNVDILSALLCAAIPVFGISLAVLPGKARFWLAVPLALSLTVLWKSGVAGGMLGILCGAVVIVPVLFRKKAARRRAALAAVCLAACALLLLYAFGGKMGGTLSEASQLLHGRWEDSFGSGRIYIWRSVWPLVKERPLLGGGPDTLGLRTDAAFERYDQALGILIHSDVDTAHNEYLNMLINLGLPALLFYLGALLLSAVQWVTYARSSPAAVICGGAVLCYCVQAFFGISSPAAAPYLWLALGILIRSAAQIRQPPASS